MTVEIFDSSTTWTAPTGVTSVTVECWGSGYNGVGGSGGGGGAYASGTVAVTPGSGYAINVDPGGTGASSYFDSGFDVKANSATGASGGDGTTSVGSVKYTGGSGGYTDIALYGGGGGGGAAGASGAGGAGANGSGTVGGAGGSGVVIIRYPASQGFPQSTTGSPRTYVTGPYRVYIWTSSGTITF